MTNGQERPGFWRRLFGRNRKAAAAPAPAALPPPPSSAGPPPPRRPAEESWLSELIAELAEGRRAGDVGGPDFTARLDALVGQGRELLATQWLSKFIAAQATPAPIRTALRVRLVGLLESLGELEQALPHLELLAALPEHASLANYHLAEHYRKRGDEARALRHYEAVLARDVDFPNVRARVERLRALRGAPAAPSAGETIGGADAVGVGVGARYRLMRELGRGATGVVYLARDMELLRDVAVKLLHPQLAAAGQAAALARFFAEARVAASLRHPNIVAILDLDEAARRIVMELASGTLKDVLRERGPRTLRRAIERHAQVLSALAAAHRRGIVHRDLKPANLLYRRDADTPGSEVMLGDFGVAHLPGAGRPAERSPAGEAVGTLAYMAPEQRRGGEADPRNDLYAAAVVLFEMLTGRVPWNRHVLLAGIRARGDFSLPAAVTDGAPADLIAALQGHLDVLGDPDPARRPDTATARAEADRLRDRAVAG